MEYDKDNLTIEIINKLVDFRGKVVLEVGCGDGKISSLLAHNTKRYIGIDTDSQSIKNATSDFENVDFQMGNGESLDFKNSYFDIVLFTLSLHHQNSKLALKEAKRVLTPKGQLLILEPSIFGELQHFFHLFNDETDQIQEALKNIKQSDFRLVQQDSFNVVMTFKTIDELYSYHFGREKTTPQDTDLITKKLKQFQHILADDQPIDLNDKINIYFLIKKQVQVCP